MKIKLVVFGMLLMLGTLFAGAQNAHAAWAVAHIVQQGQYLDQSIVVLNHVSATPTFTNQYFRLNPSSAKQMLAVALTAQSLGKDIIIEIDPVDTLKIIRLYVKND